jgi:hypothetical protein
MISISIAKTLIFFIGFILSSCTIVNTAHVMIGEKRSPIDISEVKLYTTPPPKYIEIAILNVDSGHDFRTAQGLMNTSIEKLKLDAASMGANGVILKNVGDKTSGAYGVISSPIVPGAPAIVSMSSHNYKTVSGTAIYVAQ